MYMITSSLYSLIYTTIIKKVLNKSESKAKVDLITPEQARRAGKDRSPQVSEKPRYMVIVLN